MSTCGDRSQSGSPATSCSLTAETPRAWFDHMIPRCLETARAEKAKGRPIVGILCEFTPRELILAAGAVPVCLCGGSAQTIPAAEEDLPSNLCPLIKSTYGYLISKTNPFLEMADLVVAETTCDGKKKMAELMSERIPMTVLELPQKPDDPDALAHWVAELRKLRRELAARFGVPISDDDIRRSMALMNRERRARRKLAELMQWDRPPLTGLELLAFKSSISGQEADLAQYEAAWQFYRSQTATPTQSPPPVRVLMTGVPMAHGAERPLEIIEAAGGRVVALENCVGLKPILEDVDESASDPIEALARKYFALPCSVMTRNDRRLDLIRRLAREYRTECVIDLVWQACLTYDIESARIRRLAREELGIPYLKIETDYSPSDTARIAVRVQALFETVRR